MPARGRALRALCLGLACFTSAWGCTVQEPGATSEACTGPDCQDAGVTPPTSLSPTPPLAADDYTTESVDAAAELGSADAGPRVEYAVCQGPCLPDDALTCTDFDPNDPLDARALYSDAESRLLSFHKLMSAGLDAGIDEAADASATSEVAARAGTDAGVAADPDLVSTSEPTRHESLPDAGTAEVGWSCQIDRDEGDPAVGCWLAGSGEDGAPCTTTRDCQAGFGCVGAQNAGQCRKFCCNGDQSCAELDTDASERRHFCDERTLRSPNAEGTRSLAVPVCALADMCDLSEPYPCASGTDCTCAEGRSCTVVNAQGDTGCRVPGEGELEDPCPCAAGYYCHPVEQTCKRLCNLERNDGVCGESLCQATANFPPGWGLCQPVAPETE
jgi:hypothetical protein